MRNGLRKIVLACCIPMILLTAHGVWGQTKIKLATVEPGDLQASPALAAAVVFKHMVEVGTAGSVKDGHFPRRATGQRTGAH